LDTAGDATPAEGVAAGLRDESGKLKRGEVKSESPLDDMQGRKMLSGGVAFAARRSTAGYERSLLRSEGREIAGLKVQTSMKKKPEPPHGVGVPERGRITLA
jgi:hypothetical protein